MTTRIKLRRDTAASWTSANPILAAGEPGYESDSGKIKYGDGTTHWVDLVYARHTVTPRPQDGYFLTYGDVPNQTGNDWWFDGVEIDPQGNAYYVGGQNDTDWARVVKFDINGALVWDKELTWADGYEGSANSAIYNTATDQLVVVAEMWKNNPSPYSAGGTAVITMNPTTGAIIGQPKMVRDDTISSSSFSGDVIPTDIVLTSAGDPVAIGWKYGDITQFAVTTASGNTTDALFVDMTVFANTIKPRPYSNWYITGTNITNPLWIRDINYYDYQTAGNIASVNSGSNAVFGNTWLLHNNSNELYFPDYSENFGFFIRQSGNDYTAGDTLFLNPNQWGGATSATITVVSTGSVGEITGFAITGTFNTSVYKLNTADSFDFAQAGSWTIQTESQEGFVWTPDWAVRFGGTNNDAAQAAATDSNGNIYVASRTYDDDFYGGIDRGMLVKIDSTGAKQWIKDFRPEWYTNDNNGLTGVAVDNDDDIIIVEDYLVTKLNTSGTVIWQRFIGFMDPMSLWNVCVDVDSNNNIYVAGELDYQGQITGDDYLVVKFDKDGTVLWQRTIGSTADEDTNWNNGFQILSVTDDKVYLAGSSYQGGDDVGLAISFPTDGSHLPEQHIGRFIYESIDFNIVATTATVYNLTGIVFESTPLSVTNQTNLIASTATTEISTTGLRYGNEGRIADIYSLTFEDNTVQRTAYTGGLSRDEDGVYIYNTNDFYPNLQNAGKFMTWSAPYWNDSVQIYVPHNEDVPFEIGTQMHFIKQQGIGAFMFWPWANIGDTNDIVIEPSSPADYMHGDMYNSNEGWSVRHYDWEQIPARATLTKIDTNRWLLECTSPTHIMDWSW